MAGTLQGKIRRMRHASFNIALLFLVLLTAVFSPADDDPSLVAPIISCGHGIPGGISCTPTKQDLKQARRAYSRGVKLEKQHRDEEALAKFDEASRLVPQNIAFLSAWELTKSQLAFQHTEHGDALLAKGQKDQAALEFKDALKLDPDDTYTQQRLADALPDPAHSNLSGLSLKLAESGEIHVEPKNELATFHYEGDIRGLFAELAAAYGVAPEFDDSVPTRRLRFYVDNVDFFTALNLACRVSKTMWTPLSGHQILIAANTPDNHKQFDRMSLATFVLSEADTPQQSTEVVSMLRSICEFQKISTGQSRTIQVRAPQPMLKACTELVQQLNRERPEVTFDVRLYQINYQFTRDIGMHLPDTFNLYNIPVGALAALGGQSVQSLINQLISSGGINQAGSSALSGLLAQLQGQGNSIFSQPLATFGGGLTFSGLSLDQLSAALSLNESWARSLSNATLRSSQGSDATLHIGERYPILNASYAPIYNSPAIASVIGNQSYTAPFPSISYEDLGLNLKLKPVVHGNREVSMTVEMQMRSLTGQSANGVPVIANQEYHGSIRLRDGEPAVVAGQITTNDVRSMAGIPAVADILGLNLALTDTTRQKEYDELLIMITPHIVANRALKTDEIWLSTN
jgi:general secretion pathway protein D